MKIIPHQTSKYLHGERGSWSSLEEKSAAVQLTFNMLHFQGTMPRQKWLVIPGCSLLIIFPISCNWTRTCDTCYLIGYWLEVYFYLFIFLKVLFHSRSSIKVFHANPQSILQFLFEQSHLSSLKRKGVINKMVCNLHMLPSVIDFFFLFFSSSSYLKIDALSLQSIPPPSKLLQTFY